ncbi:HCP-like protein [Ascodesmis nigricans]|uniref:HCP-like protein n=1 Tax=Ascodesmis nigricans TaxID=341454 RepID=A0A4V3SHI2_9PEZI|nr:HCP-like protein [Ascodesmis nigricans]
MPIPQPQAAVISSGESNRSSGGSYAEAFPASRTDTPVSSENTAAQEPRPTKLYPQLQYHHQQFVQTPDSSSLSVNKPPYSRNSSSPASSDGQPVQMRHLDPMAAQRRASRPISSYSTLSVDNLRANGPRSPGRRAVSGAYDLRRSSFVDLTTPAHIQHVPIASNLDNSFLQSSVGENLSLLSIGKTLEMYRQTAKKSNNVEAQYELARFMIEIIHQLPQGEPRASDSSDGKSTPRNDGLPSRKDLVREARQLLERIQRHPNAQYLLGDGFFSGLFNKNVPDHDRAFPLFIAASKHGHAEAGFRAALCYEHGWGCKRDPKKAAMYYETSAVKRHPGAMTRLGIACLNGELGLVGKHREGTKWLKFATEEADVQYPSAPFVYGCLFETGFGEDIFEDPSYAAELFAQAAELGHPEANYRLGDAYEHGKLNCPRDAALSVHYYTTAAQKGHPAAMMALCAWYLVGAEPVLEKNEEEAYIWACKASEFGLPKAEYARGYFTEMGIGCRRDPLEANVWYVRAADHGDERAVARLKIINQAASGGNGNAKEKKKKKKVEQGLESEAGGAGAGAQAPKTLKKEREEGGEKGECAIM